ncbi:PAS domain S-box protein [Candidatus Bathyarchaeota archaeon]|nr:PAS domain S-box protein [Candidatus Bathyarchaeota archaeon]
MVEKQEATCFLEVFHALFDGLEELVCIIDPETNEILLANDAFKRVYGEAEGKKCYRVLHKLESPCPFCNNTCIFGENLGKVCAWEYKCDETGRWYKCFDKAIPWSGGKYVKFGMAVDLTRYKEMENALIESEKRYRTLVEAAPDIIYTISSEGKIISLNPAFEKITGWKREEWIGKPFVEIIHPEDVPKAVENFQKTLAGKPELVELRVRTGSGEYLIGEFISVPLIENGQIFGGLGIARDITNRKKYEESIQEICTFLNALLQAIPDMVFFKDVNRRYLIVNSAFEKLAGLKKEDIIGKRAEEILPSELACQCRNSDEMVFQKNATVHVIEYTVNEKGEKRFLDTVKVPIFDKDGKTVGLIGVCRDITDRKLIEDKLRESEELFRSIVENSHDGIAIIDENYRIIYANEMLAGILGYPMDKIIGQDFRKFLAEDFKPLFTDKRLREQAKQAERQKGTRFFSKYELKIRGEKSEEKIVFVKTTTLRDAQGKMRTIAQVLDITQRRKLEEERCLFEKRLSELNRYAQKLNQARSLKEIYRLILDAMEKTLGFEYTGIFIKEGEVLRPVACRGYSKALSLKLYTDEDEAIAVKAVNAGKSVTVPDIRKEKAYIKNVEEVRSELAVPMKVGRKVLGVLNVESRKIDAFNEEHRKLLEVLASHAAIAINNLKRQEKLAALNAYGRNLSKAKSIGEVCKQTLHAVQKILGFKYIDFFLVQGKTLRLIGSLGLSRPLQIVLPLDGDKGITVRAAKIGKAVYLPNVRKDEAYVDAGVKGLLSELAVPIKLGEKVLGVLNVESEKLDAFDDEDRRFLEILASHVAIAISNIQRRENLEDLSRNLQHLIRSSTRIMQTKDIHRKLKEIAKALQKLGFEKAVISLRDENLERKDLAAFGLTRNEARALAKHIIPGSVWREFLGPRFEKYKIGDFYCLSKDDPTIPREVFSKFFVDWPINTLLYAPIRTPEGKIVAIISLHNPKEIMKLSREFLMPLEIFLHQVAMILENAELFENLEKAQKELEAYANQLEEKVEERTRELREMHDQLLKAQRLAVIGELAGMIGHDLRNPLTSIAGATYYLKRRLSQTGDQRIMEMLELIEKNIAYSNKIINDLLDYSREVKLDVAETTPENLLNEALAAVEIPQNIKVIKLANEKPKVKVDFEKMKRVFVNLVKNAVDAMPHGGTLTIKSMKEGGNVVFTVSDTGIGMTEEVLKKLWTPLFTTKAKGMGFGLAICKRFVEAHGGTITVESAPGKGTTFTVTLPIEPKIEGEGGEKIWLKTLESSLSTTTKT